jgi:hypothetical protein
MTRNIVPSGAKVWENSVVPPGLESFVPFFPALARWAKLGRPSGTGFWEGIAQADGEEFIEEEEMGARTERMLRP